MAKDEFDLDMDFPDDGFDFDDFEPKPIQPPKNKREAVVRGAGDLAYGFAGGLIENPAKDAQKLAYESIPKKVKRDADVLLGAKSDLSDHIAKSMDEIKEEGGRQLKSIAKHFDKEGMFGKFFGKVADKLGVSLDDEERGPSEAQIEAEQTRAFIAEALGEMKSIEQANAEIQQKMQEKQSATTAEILQSIYGENTAIKEFNFTVANAYYRKSLELQYRQALLANKQYQLHLEDSKIYRAQLEAIVKNTGLPDYLKLTNAERLKEEFKRRVADDVVSTFYNKDNNIMNNLVKGLKVRIDEFKSGFIEKLQGAGEFATTALESNAELNEQIAAMQENGERFSKATMAGGAIADWLKGKVIGRVGSAIGNRFSQTDSGKYLMDKLKSAANDPVAMLKEFSESNDSRIKDSGIGSVLQRIAGGAADLAGVARTDNVEFDDMAMDEATLFDGRAHTALTKVIPGLLAKIHSEIKVSNYGGRAGSHELTYDTRSGTFKTAKKLATEFKAESKQQLETTFMPSIEELMSIYVQCTGQENFRTHFHYKEQLGQALMEYYLKNPSGSTEPSVLIKDELLDKIKNDEIKEDLAAAGKIVVAMAQNFAKTKDGDDNIGDTIRAALKRIKHEGIPFLKGRMEELYKMGGGGRTALLQAGVTSKDKMGRISFDQNKLKKMTMSWNKQVMDDHYLRNIDEYYGDRAKNIAAHDGKHYEILTSDRLRFMDDASTTIRGVGTELGNDLKSAWNKVKKGFETVKDAEKRKELLDKYTEKVKDNLLGAAGVTLQNRKAVYDYINGPGNIRELQGYDINDQVIYKAAMIANALGNDVLKNPKVIKAVQMSQSEWNEAGKKSLVAALGLSTEFISKHGRDAFNKIQNIRFSDLASLAKNKGLKALDQIKEAAKDVRTKAGQYSKTASEKLSKGLDTLEEKNLKINSFIEKSINDKDSFFGKVFDKAVELRSDPTKQVKQTVDAAKRQAAMQAASVVEKTVLKDATGNQSEIMQEIQLDLGETIMDAVVEGDITIPQAIQVGATELGFTAVKDIELLAKELDKRVKEAADSRIAAREAQAQEAILKANSKSKGKKNTSKGKGKGKK